MRPILLEIPSKLLVVLLLVGAAACFVQTMRAERRRRRLRSTALFLGLGAVAIGAFQWGSWQPIPIYGYASALFVSLVVGWYLAMRFAREDGLPAVKASIIYSWTAVWSIVGARLLYVLTNPGSFGSVWDVFALWKGGVVAYGGMVGGFIATVVLCRRHDLPLLVWADAAAPSVGLGTAITRIGCLLFGCDYGAPTGLPWAVQFPRGSPAWVAHVRTGQLSPDASWSLPVHPTQLYELLAGLALFGIALHLRRVRRFPGIIFAAWVIGYGVLRPLIEIFRDDEGRGSVGPLSTSQAIGMLAVVAGMGLLWGLWRRSRTAQLKVEG